MLHSINDHDTWAYSPPRLPPQNKIRLDAIPNMLPFDGVRLPSSRSRTSHRVWFPYKVAANNWVPQVGICESSAEYAVALHILMLRDTYDVKFQPCTVSYLDDNGVERKHTHDLWFENRQGRRRLVFVRNAWSLSKPSTQREIEQILAHTSNKEADDFLVVNADWYSRQRRENLTRMHNFVFKPDPEVDEATHHVAANLKSLWFMKDIFPHVPFETPRVFASCYRLVAAGVLSANLDHVLWENSQVEYVR